MPVRTVLGFTGSRVGMTSSQRGTFLKIARGFYGEFHYGDCIGCDKEAAEMIDRIGGFKLHCHPPENPKFRAFFNPRESDQFTYIAKGYVERDLDIVQHSRIMIATPKTFTEIMRGSGTWLTIRLARGELKPLAIIWRDGTVTYERWPKLVKKLDCVV